MGENAGALGRGRESLLCASVRRQHGSMLGDSYTCAATTTRACASNRATTSPPKRRIVLRGSDLRRRTAPAVAHDRDGPTTRSGSQHRAPKTERPTTRQSPATGSSAPRVSFPPSPRRRSPLQPEIRRVRRLSRLTPQMPFGDRRSPDPKLLRFSRTTALDFSRVGRALSADRTRLALENLVQRQQLDLLRRSVERPKSTDSDGAFGALTPEFQEDWKEISLPTTKHAGRAGQRIQRWRLV